MNSKILVIIQYFVIFGLYQNMVTTELPPPCDSEIYCYGRLLHSVQMANVYKDSKTFVDMKMKYSAAEILHRFDAFMETHNNTPTQSQLSTFVDGAFENAGQEFEEWVPEDWVENPKFLESIKDPTFRKWGSDLNEIWKELGRKVKAEVEHNQEQYSIIWIPNPVIVPGGRFREFYYWDSYWIVKGLILSEMYQTVKGMLDNFLAIVQIYGHIPNGGRIYYLGRSQPPLLIPTIKLYVDATKDMKYVADNILIMEKEFDYWLTNRTKIITYNDKKYTLAMYGDNTRGPRPESYFEDIESAKVFQQETEKQAFYSELKAAAESGWDFSSRWFILKSKSEGDLSDIKTKSIIPTDLNAMMYWNAHILAEFNANLNNTMKSEKYKGIADQWMEAVMAVLWHEEDGVWLDYDLVNAAKRNYFYPSNIAPLWTGCYPKEDEDRIVPLILKYLQTMDILYPGGIPTSKKFTGEQWDFPNAWPPMQDMVIMSLYNTGNDAAHRLAFEIARIWLRSNYIAYNQTKIMYEKYDVTVAGNSGHGGEYEIQKGFGWTNGVAMDLLYRFGNSVDFKDIVINELDKSQTASHSMFGQIATGLLAIIISLTAGFIGISIYKRHVNANHSPGQYQKKRPSSRAKYTELRNMPSHSEI